MDMGVLMTGAMPFLLFDMGHGDLPIKGPSVGS